MYDEFEPFFGAIVNSCVEVEGFYSVIQALGIKAKSWPRIPARDTMLQFESFAEKKGERSAAILLRASAAKLWRLEMEIDEAYLAANYHKVLQYALAFELGRKITADPLSAEVFIREYSSQSSPGIDHEDIRTTSDTFIARVQKSREEKSDVCFIPGFGETSKAIGGFNPRRFCVITAKTGVGKTNLSLNLAYRSSEVRPTLFINMEMDLYDLNVRLFQQITGSQRWEIFNSSHENFDLMSAHYAANIQNRHDFIFTQGKALSLFQIQALIRTLSKEKNIKQVFIDYDQKIFVDGPKDEWKALQVAAEALEEIAKECDLHVVLLSQGDDEGNPRASKRIKQAASTVLHFYEESGVFILEAIKNRFGAYGAKVYFDYRPEKSTCTEVAESIALNSIAERRSARPNQFSF